MGLDPTGTLAGVFVIVGLVIVAGLAGGIAARAFLDASADDARKHSPHDRPPR